MRRHLWPLGLAALWLSPFSAAAQAASPLALEQALELAATRSAVLSAARREIDAADGALRQAGARPNPELSASVEDTRHDTRTSTALLTIPLELGGKRAARLGAAERARDVAELEWQDARARLRASVTAAYFGVLVAQERVELAKNSAALAARGAEAVSRRVAAGKLSPVDATRALVDQANAQLAAIEAEAELSIARQALAALWGDAEPLFGEAVGDVDTPPERGTPPELMRQLDSAPLLALARLDVDRRHALTALERSKAVPDLTLSVGAKRDNELGRTQAIVGVSIPLPLFDRNQGAVGEAARRADKAGDEYQALRLRTQAELHRAATQLTVARASLQSLQRVVLPAARQAYEAASQGFEAGKFGFLDVVDAQRALLQTRARYLSTLSTAYQAATAIDRLLGR